MIHMAIRMRTLSPLPLALLMATLAGGTRIADAENVVVAHKADRPVKMASLDWQPTSPPSQLEWIASGRSNPATATAPVDDGSMAMPRDPLRSAFGLFTDETPVPLLRTASLEPVSLGALGPSVGNGDPKSLERAADPARAKPVTPVTAFPIPTPKPAVPQPKVKVASIAPDDAIALPAKPSAIEAAPVLGDAPRKIPSGANAYLEIFRREAKAHNVPLWLALGVAWVESKFDPKLRGTHTVVGMMQVMPSTAREMGYRGTTNQLFDAETNIIWGIKELAKDYQLAKGNVCLAIAKYKGGFRTNHINKGAANYCSQVYRVTGMQ